MNLDLTILWVNREKQKLSMPAKSAVRVGIAQAVNPKPRFGIAVYEDELHSTQLRTGDLNEQFRKSLDYLHLYP